MHEKTSARIDEGINEYGVKAGLWPACVARAFAIGMR
jgi:hypothetical protein